MNYPQLYLKLADQWVDRVETLSAQSNSKYERVLTKLAKRFGVPIVSTDNPTEPVDPIDAEHLLCVVEEGGLVKAVYDVQLNEHEVQRLRDCLGMLNVEAIGKYLPGQLKLKGMVGSIERMPRPTEVTIAYERVS